jgi:hypothetical protein
MKEELCRSPHAAMVVVRILSVAAGMLLMGALAVFLKPLRIDLPPH